MTFLVYEDWDYEMTWNQTFWKATIDKCVKANEAAMKRVRAEFCTAPGGVPGTRRTEHGRHHLFGPHLLQPEIRSAAMHKLFWIDMDPDLGFGGEPLGFFIDDEDLAARRFDKAYAYTLNS